MLDPELLAVGPIWYVVFIFSLTCHEAAHALVARLGGDETAYLGGQVTLNPVPHMRRSPFGTIVVPILAYLIGGWMIGWASAPYDPSWQQRYPRRAALMALAGPVANLLLVILAVIGIKLGVAVKAFEPPTTITSIMDLVHAPEGRAAGALALFLSVMFSLNLLLFLFNLIPAPPLDGHAGAGLFLSEKAALRFSELMANPAFSLIGLLIAWSLINKIFWPCFQFSLALLYPEVSYR